MFQGALLVALTLWICSTIALRPQQRTGPSSQAVLSSGQYQFRPAVRQDIDDITTVLLDAFSPSAIWQYVRPEYQRYRSKIWYCTRADLERQWGDINLNTSFMNVVAVPDNAKASNERNERVVALGIWVLMNGSDKIEPFGLSIGIAQIDPVQSETKHDCCANLGVNQSRAVDFERQFRAAKRQYIDRAYPKQLYLNTLATHPDWDGNGFAALNLDWGIGLSRSLGTPISLLATPVGYPLYNDFGFRSLRNVTIETLDGWEGESLWLEVMEF